MTLSSSILFTMLYADVFNYPYELHEIVSWLPGSYSLRNVKRTLEMLVASKKLSYSDPYYCIYAHQRFVSLRKDRELYSKDKLNKAKAVARVLQYIPSILLVGVTGGVSMMNADRDDDIDFIILTSSGTVWVTRLLTTLLVECFSLRRRPEGIEVKDAICLNMFVSEDACGVPKQEQDVYTAHEVLQMLPIWERANMYSNFLKKNAWVSSLFPNRWNQRKRDKTFQIPVSVFGTMNKIVLWFFRLSEQPVKFLQLWYMHNRRTTEVVSDSIIRFHPKDARVWIRQALQKKMKLFHLPLDNNFFRP